MRKATRTRILDVFLGRGVCVDNPPLDVCQEALLREISLFMPKRNHRSNYCSVVVYNPEQKDAFTRALIIFYGRLHLEAANASNPKGKVL